MIDPKPTDGDTTEKQILQEDPSLFVDDAQLLQQISSAESMAQGMESRLDDLLQTLNEILAGLGAEETPGDTGSTSGDLVHDATKTSSGPT